MKKHLSVFMLMARSTIYKLFGLFAIMTAVEFGLFYAAMSKLPFGESYGLELVVDQSRILWVFGLTFILMTVLLCSTGYETSSRQGYILMRLSISEKWVVFWQTIYNTICYILLWAVQVLGAAFLSHLYVTNVDPSYVSSQTIFLAFYRNKFFHFLLPFEDRSIWALLITLICCFGFGTAYLPYTQRNRHKEKVKEVAGNEA